MAGFFQPQVLLFLPHRGVVRWKCPLSSLGLFLRSKHKRRMIRESRRAAATSAAEARRLTHVEARAYVFALGDRRGRLPLATGGSLWKSPFSRKR